MDFWYFCACFACLVKIALCIKLRLTIYQNYNRKLFVRVINKRFRSQVSITVWIEAANILALFGPLCQCIYISLYEDTLNCIYYYNDLNLMLLLVAHSVWMRFLRVIVAAPDFYGWIVPLNSLSMFAHAIHFYNHIAIWLEWIIIAFCILLQLVIWYRIFHTRDAIIRETRQVVRFLREQRGR